MKEEVRKVLQLLQDGKVDAAQAAELLDAMGALDEDAEDTGKSVAARKARAKKRILRIHVESEDGDDVNVRIPMSLASAGLGIARSYGGEGAEALKNLDMDQVMEAVEEMIENGESGEIVNVSSADGDTVRIWLE